MKILNFIAKKFSEYQNNRIKAKEQYKKDKYKRDLRSLSLQLGSTEGLLSCGYENNTYVWHHYYAYRIKWMSDYITILEFLIANQENMPTLKAYIENFEKVKQDDTYLCSASYWYIIEHWSDAIYMKRKDILGDYTPEFEEAFLCHFHKKELDYKSRNWRVRFGDNKAEGLESKLEYAKSYLDGLRKDEKESTESIEEGLGWIYREGNLNKVWIGIVLLGPVLLINLCGSAI